MSRSIKGLTVRKMTVTDTLISGKMRHELWVQLSTNISWISNASLTDASAKAGVHFCLISLRLALPKLVYATMQMDAARNRFPF